MKIKIKSLLVYIVQANAAVSIKKSPDNTISKLDYDSQYAMPKLNIVRSTHLMPRPSLLSETTPIKSYDFPSQKSNTRRVDSKSEAKSENKSGTNRTILSCINSIQIIVALSIFGSVITRVNICIITVSYKFN